MVRRRRTGYLVLAVVVGHFFLISVQIGAQPRAGVLERVTFGAFAEMQRTLASARSVAADLWSRYVALRDLHARNQALAEEVATLELRLQEERALAQQARGLRRLLDMRRAVDLRTVGARVIATAATPYVRTLAIDRGANDGVYAEAAVIAPKGVVGRIVGSPAARASRVQLLIDRHAAAGARVERTRVSGIVTGSNDGAALRMEYVANSEDVRVGDRIVTSGTDGIYPEGFGIGAVTSVAPGPDLLVVRIAPAIDFSRLEEVLVIVSDEPAVASSARSE